MNLLNKNSICNIDDDVQQLIEVIFIHKYHKNNPKEGWPTLSNSG